MVAQPIRLPLCSQYRAAPPRHLHTAALPELKIKTDPFMKVSGSIPCPGVRTQLHVTTSLSTGGGPVSYVQLSEGGFQVVYPLALWSRFSGVVKVRCGYG